MAVTLRVCVVSPLPAVRAGLTALLAADPGIAVVAQASTPEGAAVQPFSADGTRADVLVLDAPQGLTEPDIAWVGPGEPPGLVVLGPAPGADRLLAALADRAWSYVARDASGEQLAAAVRAAAAGLVSIDVALGGQLLARLRVAPDAAGAADGEGPHELTPREREVLDLVAIGLPNKLIARRLSISEHTVKFHIAAILTKLGAGSRTEAVHLAARRGLVAL